MHSINNKISTDQDQYSSSHFDEEQEKRPSKKPRYSLSRGEASMPSLELFFEETALVQSPSRIFSINDLPEDIHGEIGLHLSLPALLTSAQVCKQWNSIYSSNRLWLAKFKNFVTRSDLINDNCKETIQHLLKDLPFAQLDYYKARQHSTGSRPLWAHIKDNGDFYSCSCSSNNTVGSIVSKSSKINSGTVRKSLLYLPQNKKMGDHLQASQTGYKFIDLIDKELNVANELHLETLSFKEENLIFHNDNQIFSLDMKGNLTIFEFAVSGKQVSKLTYSLPFNKARPLSLMLYQDKLLAFTSKGDLFGLYLNGLNADTKPKLILSLHISESPITQAHLAAHHLVMTRDNGSVFCFSLLSQNQFEFPAPSLNQTPCNSLTHWDDDSALILAGYEDGSIAVWNLVTQKLVKTHDLSQEFAMIGKLNWLAAKGQHLFMATDTHVFTTCGDSSNSKDGPQPDFDDSKLTVNWEYLQSIGVFKKR